MTTRLLKEGGEEEGARLLVLPSDDEWRELLRTKKSQYDEWLTAEFRFVAPEARDMVKNRTQRGYAKRLIEELLANGNVDTWGISRTLESEQGDAFNLEHFEYACAVIDRYISDIGFLRQSVQKGI